ncbi:MAG TPA: M48 family metalloprotease [Pirellulales bacterium]|nr:M48 family metalloprotease [Pirellulales bacterium]
MNEAAKPRPLRPLPYQQSVLDYLKFEDPAVWQWFAARRANPEQAAAARLELLKSTYRIDRHTQESLYALAEEVAGELGLEAPITFYQAQHPQGLNACLAGLPGEAHLILSGPVTASLSHVELKALLGHELAHLLLNEGWEGEHLVASQMLDALANDAAAPASYAETARLHGLYAELFCDRGAWFVTQDLAATISVLVKVSTGLSEVHAESYLRQAEEIFSQEQAKTEGMTHPESYIRARALALWVEQGDGAAAQIARMLEGAPEMAQLDLLHQRRMAGLTRRLIDALLSPKWFQTPRVLAHARGFFEEYAPPDAAAADESLSNDVATPGKAWQDYYGYVLLDFVTVDRDLEELPLAAALVLSRRLGLAERFKEIVLKELKLTKKRFNQTDERAEELLAQGAR